MLAGETPDGKEPFLGLLEILRVELQRIETVLDLAPGLVELGHGAGERGDGPLEPALGLLGGALEPAQGVGHGALGAVIAKRLRGAHDVLADALGALHHAALGVELGLFAGHRGQPVELIHRVAQEVFLGAHRLERRLRRVERLAGLAPLGPGRACGGQFGVDGGVAVENGAMARGVEQAAVVMLAVQLHQRLRQAPQHLAAGASVVDPAGLAAIGAVDPAQDQLFRDWQPGVFQHRAGGMAGGQLEHRGDLALRGAAAHQLGAAAPAQHEAQRIQQDRLAGAGLAGQYVETGLEREVQPVNDQHVADLKRSKHELQGGRSARHPL